jgi:hypothetical protein
MVASMKVDWVHVGYRQDGRPVLRAVWGYFGYSDFRVEFE